MPRTGTSEDLFQRDVPLIWRHQHYMKLSKLSSYQRMHCPSSDCHFIEERNKIHRLIAWEWIWGRKSRPNKRGVTRELSKKCLAKPEMHFNIGKVWNPVCCHGNKTVKLKPWSTISKILLQRITNWYKLTEISFSIRFDKIWLSVWRHQVANSHILNTWIPLEQRKIFENSKQHFSSNAGRLFIFWNGFDRKDAVFVIVAL